MKNKLLLIHLIAFAFTQVSKSEFETLTFHQTEQTLRKIAEIISNKQKGVYFRFGDGDVNLANGQSELLQEANNKLTTEMREAFSLNGPTILKTLPLHCKEFGGFETGMFGGNHESPYLWCIELLNKAKHYWNGPITDVYTTTALHFAATTYEDECVHFLKFLRNSHCTIFVGNKNVPHDIRELLFGKECYFVPTPINNSYSKIDRIEQETLRAAAQCKEYQVIITAMGCSGRILQKRLWKKLDNVFLFDFGSLMDALCGWNTRVWIEATNFNQHKFIENLKK